MLGRLYTVILMLGLTMVGLSQNVINDVGLRLGFTVDKKINDRFSLNVKMSTRQVENMRLFNRIYIRPGLDITLNKHVKASVRVSYISSRKGFKSFSGFVRYALSLTYKLKLNDRLTFYDKLIYQNTSNYFIKNEWVEQKDDGVIRNKITLKYKLNRRGDVYARDEQLFRVVGKHERYFARNRVYLGYVYKLSASWDLDAYFILERTHGGSGGPQDRTFFYGLTLGYHF